MTQMSQPRETIDLRLYLDKVSDDFFEDTNHVRWHFYNGTPVAFLRKSIDIEQRWPNPADLKAGAQIPPELFFEAIDAIWLNLSKANPGRTRAELEDGLDGEDVLTLLNLLSLRLQERAARAQHETAAMQNQDEDQQDTPAPLRRAATGVTAPSRTSARTRKRTTSGAPSPAAT